MQNFSEMASGESTIRLSIYLIDFRIDGSKISSAASFLRTDTFDSIHNEVFTAVRMFSVQFFLCGLLPLKKCFI